MAHGGINDCKIHVEGPRHVRNHQSQKAQPSIGQLFRKGPEEEERRHKIMNAELLFVSFLIEHNIPVSAADHAGPLFRRMFPDSKIAQGYQCGRTKTTALIHHQAKEVSSDVVSKANEVFSLSTDGSNDASDKFFPVVLSHRENGLCRQSLLCVPTVKEASATGENIFNMLDVEVRKHGLNWENCLSLGSDNAPVMSGNKRGVLGFIHEKNSETYFAGCPVHLLHIAAKKGAQNIPVAVEDTLTDIYYYLKHSSKRQTELKEIQDMCGTQNLKVLKHVPTRWLSLGQCLSRLLILRDPLKRYFSQEVKAGSSQKVSSTRPQRAYDFLNSYTATSYCYFLCYAIEMFDKYNTALQAGKPLIHKLQRMLFELYRSLLVKFLSPATLTGKLLDVNVNTKLPYELKTLENVMIGERTRAFMSDKKMPKEKVDAICRNAREFYKAAATYIREKLPLTDPVLKNAEVFDLEVIAKASFSSIKFFLGRFSVLKPSCSVDVLEEQFSMLQSEQLDSAILAMDSADEQWNCVALIKDSTGHAKYADLAQLAQKVLLIPHSNAACERVFSAVRKIRTDFRGSMNPNTLEDICTVKVHMLNEGLVCHEQLFSMKETKKAKKATVAFLSDNSVS